MSKVYTSGNFIGLTPLQAAKIRKDAEANVLPADPPADLEPAYRAAVWRLMRGDKSAQTKINELRAAEKERLARGEQWHA